ncbi:hypothetical protein ACH5RR_002558 [Cinchona calisaya]|uniref:Uncharacterized protein n=1 Tax=Cinchona calisaya TaxID=153742 RepID=A0ABD3AS98_9GENT
MLSKQGELLLFDGRDRLVDCRTNSDMWWQHIMKAKDRKVCEKHICITANILLQLLKAKDRKVCEKHICITANILLQLLKAMNRRVEYSVKFSVLKAQILSFDRKKGRLTKSHPYPSASASDLSSCTTTTTTSTRIRRRITSSRFVSVPSHDEKQLSFPPHPSSRLTRNSSEPAVNRRVSPEKEERSSYTTRGSVTVAGNMEENNNNNGAGNYSGGDGHNNNNRGGGNYYSGGGWVWPKVCIALTSKEKEEDFMAMKGCKLPQRPKKRPKLIQRTLLLVSPGAWLTDMSFERYEVREKKTSKKRPRGLKAMGNVESDSE